jgi:hypothetical protein
MNFACGNGHIVAATDRQYVDIDIEGYLCPVCLGQAVGHGDKIDSRLLAPMQEEAA